MDGFKTKGLKTQVGLPAATHFCFKSGKSNKYLIGLLFRMWGDAMSTGWNSFDLLQDVVPKS
jgi:hypothetical protein